MAATESGTVGKALGLLDLVAAQTSPIRFAELLRASDLPKATLHRLLKLLVIENMLRQDAESGAYLLGSRLMRLAQGARQQSSPASLARPHLDTLARETGLTVHLAQLDYGHVLYLDRRATTPQQALFSEAGKIAPAYCTAVGKAMLAYLDPPQLDQVLNQQSYQRFTPTTLASATLLRQSLQRVRKRGFAVDREEYQGGVICVAVPVLSAENRVLGAVSLTATTKQTDLTTLETWVPQLRDHAETLAVDLSHWALPAG